MTDLENRLRADAARDARRPVPDLDAMLDRVVTDEAQEEELTTVATRAPRPTVRRIGPWLAAAAAVVALGAGVVAISTHDSGPDRPSRPAAPTGLPSTRGDTVLRYLDKAGFDAVARVKGDSRSLDVVVPYDRSIGGCSVFEPRATVTSQTSAQIVVGVSGYRYVDRDGEGYSCGNAGLGGEVVKRVQLDAPLGDRTVIDGSNSGDQAIVGVIDPAAVPTPTYLPKGYSEFSSERIDLAAGGYTASRSYASAGDKLIVSGGPTRNLMGDGSFAVSMDVNGVRGELDDDGCLYWSPRPGYNYAVCLSGPNPVSNAERVRVAQSIR